eukprot:3358116-Prymnesium_polylepis.1
MGPARVSVSREVFEAALRGRSFQQWDTFVAALPADAVEANEVALVGLSLALIVLVNVVVW